MEHTHDGVPVDHTGMNDEELDRCRREAELEQEKRRGDRAALHEIGVLITKYMNGCGLFPDTGFTETGRLAVAAIPLEPEEDSEPEDDEPEGSEFESLHLESEGDKPESLPPGLQRGGRGARGR